MMTLRSFARRSVLETIAQNAFCPTGKGGGKDPTCSPGKSSNTSSKKTSKSKLAPISSAVVQKKAPDRDAAVRRSRTEIRSLAKKLNTGYSADPPPPGSDDGEVAARFYSGDSYIEINKALRSGIDPAKVDPVPAIDDLQKVASKKLPEKTIVYRGVAGDMARKLLRSPVGSTIESKGFVSTSLDYNVATGFAGSTEFEGTSITKMVMEIKAKRGVSISGISEYEDEAEILQPHGTKYKVTGKRQSPDGKALILMVEEV